MASDRAKRGGGKETDLSQQVIPATPYQITISIDPTGKGRGSVVQGNGADWFGPLNPMNPSAPPEVSGRRFDYPAGYNLAQTPKQYEPIGFAVLRALADNYDLVRIVIETRKDQLATLNWNIVPRDPRQRIEGEIAERIKKVEEFFLRPDKVHFWDEWLRLVLEDLLVIDAPSLYRRRTRGGELYGLEPIDGATIKRVIDDWGRTPEPPTPAYQQVLKGLPAIDYTTKDLLYKPRNLRTNKVYGYSPVEQIIMTINIALRRQVFQLNYFTEGNIPEALIGVPETWTPDQIKQFQDWFDGILQGNLAERRRARFVPNAVGKTYIPTKDNELFGKAEEWLARVVCFAFSVNAQPFVQMMNRATAEQAGEDADRQGLMPLMKWVKGLVDTVILDDFGYTDVQFKWQEKDEADEKKKQEIITGYVSDGLMSINEGRIRMGEDPDPDPIFNELMMKTSMGYILIKNGPIQTNAATEAGVDPKEDEPAQDEATPEGAEGEASPVDKAYNPDQPRVPKGSANGGQWASTGADNDAAVIDISGEERMIDPDTFAAEVPVGTKPTHSADGVNYYQLSDGRVVGSRTSGDVTQYFVVLNQTTKLAKSQKPYADLERPRVVRAEKRLAKSIAKSLKDIGAEVARQAGEILSEATKADDPSEDLDVILDLIEFSLSELFEEFDDEMVDIFEDAANIMLAQLGVERTDEIVNRVNERAVEWSGKRAGELVRTGPDGRAVLDQTTRNMIRETISKGLEAGQSAEDIAKALETAYAFSEDRARLIAMTEIARANSEGSLESYRAARDAGVDIKKAWFNLEDSCEICAANAAQGPIDLDEPFQSGDMTTPGHPACRCATTPVVGDNNG